MKSYRTLALKELLSQKVTSILILIAVVLSTMMTTIVGQSIGVLSAMREQQAIAIGGNRYATFLQMNADQLHALEQDERLSYVGKSIYMGSLELSPSLTLGLMEYWDDTAAIYPSSTSVEEGRLPEAPMEIGSRNKAHNGILSFFSWYILQSVTCHLLFVTLTYPVENTRVYKRASSPLCFLCVYVAFSSQQTTRTHWRK